MELRRGRKSNYEMLGTAVVALLGAFVVVMTARALLVVFGGVLFGIVLRAAALGVAKHTKVSYNAALVALVASGFALAAAALVWGLPSLGPQVAEMAEQLPAAMQRQLRILRHAAQSGDIAVPLAAPSTTSSTGGPAKLLSVALGSSVEVLGGLAIVVFVGVYSAAQPRHYVGAIVHVLPRDRWKQALRAMHAVYTNLAYWLAGRLVAMTFVGVTSTIAFLALGLRFPLLLGLFAGLLTFVEYAGAVISAVPPVIVALAKGPSTALWVLLLFTGLHVIEGYVLTPMLARASVRLLPAFTLGAQVVFAVLVGPLGLTFSTPLLVVAVAGLRGWRGESPKLAMTGKRRAGERRRSPRLAAGRGAGPRTDKSQRRSDSGGGPRTQLV